MKNVSIIGGDNRNLILSNLLEQDDYNVFRFGLGTEEKSIEESIKQSNFIITATPFSVDSENIYSPLTDKKINIQKFIDLIHNKTIIAGSISNEYINKFNYNNNKVIDIMKNENLVIKNTIPTAEGVIKIIIEKHYEKNHLPGHRRRHRTRRARGMRPPPGTRGRSFPAELARTTAIQLNRIKIHF